MTNLTAEAVDTAVSSEDIQGIIERLDNIIELLTSIDNGLKHIVAIGLLLIAFIGVWKIFNNWYFGGV